MMDLLVTGGLLFTIPLTVVAAAVLGVASKAAVSLRKERGGSAFWSRMLFHLGLFAFVLGIFSQTISLYQMMSAIEAAGNVAPAIVMGGLKVSMIAPVYGLIIFAASILLRLAIDLAARETAYAA